ncbi:hypothetical protein TPHA_0J01120 [Tetrapisispora phaffii CBS 4417]|uniref:Large ribosomal subunit protein mL43 n=1 Tax=Tetrapisispora phaffii (strain ATCC 24235 / CBS 4417 / NBRC 1672 / NRRL Y-8282 / UCD 70-5) TaxID=1071381 RepID=G8BYJ2_TETPH|nr:mitochondrial 54S ribosomal protein MRPL51 TPHA_0J01120 [Tetrapisispora phaffii CBS 4417]CCE64934.1 hypothetical protein TPHA_0J01120 [Tetrapisispora phaffii CBS 4417]
MVVKAISQSSVARNGVGAFVFPVKKITLQYCNWGGSSDGIRKFLVSSRLDKFAEKYPHIEFNILRKPGHPILRGEYTNGREKVICVRNLNPNDVENKLVLLKNSSGNILQKLTRNDNVKSLNSSVRGVWSPLHADSKYTI